MSIPVSLCLLASAPLQQSIEREVTYFVTSSASREASPGSDTRFVLGNASVSAQIVFDIPSGNRVRLREVFVRGQTTGTLEYDATATHPSGMTIRGGGNDGVASCGGSCSWGPSEFSTNEFFLGSDQQLGFGERTARIDGLPSCGGNACNFPMTFNENSAQWDLVRQFPVFITTVSISGVSLSGADANGDPASFDLNALASSVSATSTVITRYKLDAAPLTEYCTSPANSTGVSAALAAFGSQQEGSEYLTIRASDLPASSFSILCVGTSPIDVPMGSFNLCVGNPQRKGGVMWTGDGFADFDIDLRSVPAGDSVYLQAIFRDPAIGVGASNASSFVVQPE